MSENHVWHDPNSTSHKTLIVHDGRVFVGSASDAQLVRIAALLAKGESPMAELGDKAVCINDQKLRRIESQVGSRDITMRYTREGLDRFTMVELPDDEAHEQALSALQQIFQLQRSTEQWTPLRAAKWPAFALGAIAFFAFVLAGAAAELEAGEEADIHGRRRGLKRLLMFLLDIIGPTGVYVIGGLLGALALWWLFRRITNPPIITTLEPVE